MITTWRATARVHRFEIIAVLIATVGLTALALYGVKALTDLNVPASCFNVLDAEGTPGCGGVAEFFALNAGLASKGIGSMLVAPYVIGVVLGVPLIGTLLERRTAMLVWSMTPSRRRWLIGQITFVALVTVLAITPPALAADVLERVSYPQYQADASFNDYGQRGLLPVAVATAALSVSVLTGLIVGRTLPGVLVAGALCLGLFLAPTVVRPHLAPLDVLDRARVDSDAMQLGAGWRRPDGRVLTLGEAAASSPFAAGTPEQQSWIQDHYELVVLGFAPARYGDVVLRESLLLFGLAGGVAGASLAIVGRRRPY